MQSGDGKMITKYYKCEFLSDIVLPASSNTQGNILNSDFISGSNFLGMVASSYDEFRADAFEVFHSGAVSFGDGHIVVKNKPTYKIPLSFHNIKNENDKYFNRILLSDDELRIKREKGEQLKQIRSGFMSEDGLYTTPSYNYSQKSSYDKINRRSQDSGMYGYSALKSGTNWIFKIEFADEKYISKVEEKLLGDKKLGKSKSSQYGQVKISPIDTPKTIEAFIQKDNITYIYANSRLALYDKDGNFEATPTIENLGLSSGEIDWEKTYIKTSTYHPYNYKRQTKEYTRVCINKGSVIAVKNCEGLGSKIGAFVSEGFGDILVNPKFLEQKEPQLTKYEESKDSKETNTYDKNLISFLSAKQESENSKFKVASDVQDSYKEFLKGEKISKSQWGQIRSFSSTAKDKDELIAKIEEYISKGVSKKQWEDKKEKLFKEIESSKNPESSLEFTKLLAMIVSKHTKGGNDGK